MSVDLHKEDPTPAPNAPHDPDRTAPNCAMVIFGAGGDLTKRLVVPALYNLSKARQLPESFALIGVDLAEKSAEAWCHGLHQYLEDAVKGGGAEFEAKSIDEDTWQRLTRNVSYVQGDLTKPEAYRQLAQALETAGGKSAIGVAQGNRDAFVAAGCRSLRRRPSNRLGSPSSRHLLSRENAQRRVRFFSEILVVANRAAAVSPLADPRSRD